MTESFQSQTPPETKEPAQAGGQPPAAAPSDPPAQAPAEPFLKAAGRTFSDQDAAVKHIQAEQEHISKLEGEARDKDTLIAELEERLKQSTTLEEVVNKVTSQSRESTDTQGISKDEILSAAVEEARKVFRQERTAEQEKRNMDQCMKLAQTAFGSNPDAKINEIAEKLGEDFDFAVKTAKSNPVMFQTLFIPKGQQTGSGGAETMATLQSGGLPQKQTGNGQPPKNFMKMSVKERSAHVKDRLAELGIQTGY